MKKVAFVFVLLSSMLFTIELNAQEHHEYVSNSDEPKPKHSEHKKYKHNFEIFTGYTTFKQTSLPTVGCDVEFMLSERFGIGALMDYEIGNKIHPSEFLFTSTIFFIPFDRFKIGIGDGVAFVERFEFEEEMEGEEIKIVKKKEVTQEYLIRVGCGYEFDLGERYFLSPTIQLDYTQDETSLVFGVNTGIKF